MPSPSAIAVTARDIWVEHADGRLFARRWTPCESAVAVLPGATLVLLHDSLGSVELWRDFPARLCRRTGVPVVAYDRLGFGRSDPFPGELEPDFIQREAAVYFPAVVEQVGIDRFVGFGHSVGGGMAIHCAAAHPDRCLGVVTEAAQAFVEERTTAGIRAVEREFADQRQFARLERYHGAKARWVLDAWIDNWTGPAFADWSLDAILARVRCPVLAIHGELDEYGSVQQPERIAAFAGGRASTEVMADTHHIPHRERPDAVLALVREFLESLG